MDDEEPDFAGIEGKGEERSFFNFGNNHVAMNVRDRILYSACLKGDGPLFRARVTMLILGLPFFAIGAIFSFTDDSVSSSELVASFFCTTDYLGWITFLLYLVLALKATKRVQDFEKTVKEGELHVEIFQSADNFYSQKLTCVERSAWLFYTLSFVLVMASFGHSIALFVRDPDVESDNFLEERFLRSLLINTLFAILAMLNLILSRQTFSFRHLLATVVVGLVFLGGNYGCSVGLDVEIYADLDWLNTESPATIYEGLSGLGVFVLAFSIGKVIECAREKYYYSIE